MNLCLMCDLHLPFDENALQYDVLRWAVEDIKKKNPDCIIFAGDVTCDGNEDVYDYFVKTMKDTDIPFLFIPGNSDLRCNESCVSVQQKASNCKNVINGISVFAVNDSDKTVSDEQLSVLEEADNASVVFMHHPLGSHKEGTRSKLSEWRKTHKDAILFYGHLHLSKADGNSVSLQAMDPDKSIGENPCITYFNTETKELRKAYYFSPVPTDLYNYFGISCYKAIEQIDFAINNKLKFLELRPGCVNVDEDELLKHISLWRKNGGENLSVHFPDIGYSEGMVNVHPNLDKLVDIVKLTKADRITQHVPMVSVREVNENGDVLKNIAEALSDKLNSIGHDVVIGIENMHMTAKDSPDDTRRFGYIPEECIRFMEIISSKCRHKVGINFDIGHARNNAPYSQKYQISTWLSMVGKYIVGYHMHQVNYVDGVFENHMPITDVYGHLISYASFFRYWVTERINKAPVVFEMRPEDAYAVTLDTFDVYRKKNVFDVHSHTYYSICGRDNPHLLINTAIQNGLSVFGICDHNHGIKQRKAEYLKEMRELGEQYRDRIRLFCGIEIATVPDRFDIHNPADIKDFDYCLIEHITDTESIVKGDIFEFCKHLGIKCGIAHTDLFEYCDMYGYDYEDFFARMAENQIFWEMNVSYDTIHKYKEHQYVLDFISDSSKVELIKKSGVYVSIGFDSHRCEDYDGFRVHKMYDFLKKNNIKTVDELL